LSENPTYLDIIAEVLIEQYPQLADKVETVKPDS